jgi:hypothetical protein
MFFWLHEGSILFAGSRICCGEGRNLKVIIISVGRIYSHIPDINTGMNSRSKDPTRPLYIIDDLRQYQPHMLVGVLRFGPVIHSVINNLPAGYWIFDNQLITYPLGIEF